MTFDRFAVVRVLFLFTDRAAAQKNRPALVLSDAGAFNTPAGHSVSANSELGRLAECDRHTVRTALAALLGARPRAA